MPFSKKIKLEAKRRSAFRCCICHRLFVEVHHIIPQVEGGADTLNNAATLCAECHDLFGGNPEKRAQIREMRDAWWCTMEERARNLTHDDDISDCTVIERDETPHGKLSSRTVAIYHRIFATETFEDAATVTWELLQHAQKLRPGAPRILFLDIDGHLNANGGFDEDMYEFQRHFILGAVRRYLKGAHMPLISFRVPTAQRNDLPTEVRILPNTIALADAIAGFNDGVESLYVGDADRWVRPDKHK